MPWVNLDRISEFVTRLVGVSPLSRHHVGSKVASQLLVGSMEVLHMNLVISPPLLAVFSDEKWEGRVF
jgi:uncharacterized membrane protein YczE